jgi:hypothetical protein
MVRELTTKVFAGPLVVGRFFTAPLSVAAVRTPVVMKANRKLGV